jgi:hypothetical protein
MASMYTHRFDAVKGWPSPYALDKQCVLDADTDAPGTVFKGTVGHLSPAAAGKFRLGLPLASASAGTAPMPLFVWSAGDDFDVAITSTNAFGTTDSPASYNMIQYASAGASSVTAVGATYNLTTFVAKGGFELATTEYRGTPTTGQLLTSGLPVNGAYRGKLMVATTGDQIPDLTILCGVVSGGVEAADAPGAPAWLTFWPIYMVWRSPIATAS